MKFLYMEDKQSWISPSIRSGCVASMVQCMSHPPRNYKPSVFNCLFLLHISSCFASITELGPPVCPCQSFSRHAFRQPRHNYSTKVCLFSVSLLFAFPSPRISIYLSRLGIGDWGCYEEYFPPYLRLKGLFYSFDHGLDVLWSADVSVSSI